MIKRLFFSLLIFLSGCSGRHFDTFIDSEFIPYIDMYRADKLHYNNISTIKHITMQFKSASNSIGVCIKQKIGFNMTYSIEIDPKNWFNSTADERQLLVYHELGHCDLNLPHSNTPISIMNEVLMDEYTFSSTKNYYINMLFTKGK